MPQAAPALLDTRLDDDAEVVTHPDRTTASPVSSAPGDILLSIHEEIAPIEPEWRAFERRAEGTVFQTCEWLATWQRHIGDRRGVRPAVVIGRDGSGSILFLIPLAIERVGFARKLTWLGADLCDYNAPLLAPEFSAWVNRRRFQSIWQDIVLRLRSHPRLRYDYVDLMQMPETIGGQSNPMLRLGAAPHSANAYRLSLTDSWDSLYARRSSATRRHDRAKRQKLAEHGAINPVHSDDPGDIAYTLDVLMAHKASWFAEMGMRDMFKQPGCREFFLDIATSPWTRHITHVSRLDVGGTIVATNFGLIFGGCYYHVLASYDRTSPTVKFGPGMAHLHELLRYAIHIGLQKFDFSIGDERYKHEWCDSELKLYDHLSAARLRGLCFVLPMMAARRLKRWIKQTPALWRLYRKARTVTAPLRGPLLRRF